MGELKPCPFCGRKAEMKLNASTMNCSVYCDKCAVSMKRNFKGNKRLKDMLAELMEDEWNRRADDGKKNYNRSGS